MLQCKQIDELMMDWLYQELDASSSQAVEAHVGGCARCTAEVGSLRRTREVFRDLRAEEPPAAVSAILLHEAARHAPAVAPRTAEVGFRDRLRAWFQPLFAHPAAAAVATLVLVAGVAGLLWVNNGSDMAKVERQAASAKAPPAGSVNAGEGGMATATPAPVATPSVPAAGEALGNAPAPELRQEPAKDAPADGYAAGLLDEKIQSELSRARDAEPKSDKSVVADRRKPVESKEEALAFSKPKPSKLAKQAPRADVANAISGADPLVAGDGVSAIQGGRMESESPKAPPPAPTTTASTRGAASGASMDDGDLASTTYRPYRDQKPLTPQEKKWLEGQQVKLDSAVKGNRCNEAARIANDMMDKSADFYVQRNTATRKAQPCQTAVASETQRRAKARSKNVGAGPAQAAPQQQKMKSAPREADEAQSAD